MRVMIDATAVPANRGGVGRYVDELVPALVDEGVDLVVVCQARDEAYYRGLAPSADVVAAPAAASRTIVRMLWEQVRLPTVARHRGVDVLHSPHYTMPVFSGVPVVVTLHDATFFSLPEAHTRVKRHFFRAWTWVAVRHAAAIVVPSDATRREVLAHVGGRRHAERSRRFTTAYHGVDGRTFHPTSRQEQDRVRTSLGLEGRRYVAFLGTLEPRKNVPALVRAFVAIESGDPVAPALVLAGGKGWDPGVEPALAEAAGHVTVLRPGYLPLSDLAAYLGGAEVVAYPSLGEGFGLPVLEAMACGAPVLTTRALSLPEVGGDAVEYCGPEQQEIADGLRRLLADDGRRAMLAARALRRAAGFTWKGSARAHAAAYAAAAG